MSCRIFIIQNEDIIREGLTAILKRNPLNEVVILDSADQLMKHVKERSEKRVVFCPDDCFRHSAIEEINKNRKIKLVFVSVRDNGFIDKNSGISTISIETGSREILEIVNSHFDDGEGVKKELTGEELTKREKEILRFVASGFSNKQIADKLYISIHTVITHRKNITEKTGIKSVSGLTVYAILKGIIDTENISPAELI